jgi:glycosyltransferase involved in cell wall biosynthesis
MQIELTILIPVYNEFYLLEKFVKNLVNTFKKKLIKFVFVDDGSTDGSNEWLSKNIPIICKLYKYDLILLKKNVGKGCAIRQGIKKIEGDYVLFIDSDHEYDPKDGLEIYEIAKNNNYIDVIYGSRYLGGKIQLRKHFFHDKAVRINTFIFNILFDQSITDLHTGTKVIKSKLIKNLKLTLNRFGLEIDMSSQIAKKNYNIYEYGISYVERTKSQGKKITFLDGLLSYYFLFKTRFLQNDAPTSFSIIYSLCFMTYAGTYFGMGQGKIMIVVIFMIIGLMLGINRKIIPLSLILLSIYVGSLFSSGNGRIYPIIILFIIGLILSKKIANKYQNTKKNSFMKYLM